MGAAQSSFDARHVRIWQNLSSLTPPARMQMLDTLLSAQEYIAVAKRAGVYAGILQWIGSTRRGEYAVWPEPGQMPSYTPTSLPAPTMTRIPAKPSAGPPTLRITNEPYNPATHALANIPPPKRALDILHHSYAVLGIDDSKPLTYEVLRTAYKKAGVRTHPDKGGSAEKFDEVTRAYLYLEEVINKLMARGGAAAQQQKVPVYETAIVPAAEKSIVTQMQPVVQHQPAKQPVKKEPPIALNPKKLDMAMFNKLFEENRMPDPDNDDGYGDWLKTNKTTAPQADLRGKFNKDTFNKMFEDEAARSRAAAAGEYTPPAELHMAPHLGADLHGGSRGNYTNFSGSGGGVSYTDLKYAYDEGSTFSQQVAGVSLDGRPKTFEQAKAEYGAAPPPMTAAQAAAVAAYDKARTDAEAARQERMKSRDSMTDEHFKRLQERFVIRQ